MSSTISNLYASKIFAEHPLALWALDDNLPYISLLEEQYKDIENTWVFSGSGQFVEYSSNQIPLNVPLINDPTALVTKQISSNTNFTLESPSAAYFNSLTDLDQDKQSVSINLYVYPKTSIIDYYEIGFEYFNPAINDTVRNVNRVEPIALGLWQKITHTTSTIPSNVIVKPIFTIQYKNASSTDLEDYHVFLNAVSVGQWSELFHSESTGIFPIPISSLISSLQESSKKDYLQEFNLYLSSASVNNISLVEADAYGFDEDNTGYYVVENNKLLAINGGMPLVFGSKNITQIVPGSQSTIPSIVFPGQDMFSQNGINKNITAEFWLRVDHKSLDPIKIFGPLFSKDGLYIDEEYLSLKIGNYSKSHFVGKWYRPMLIDICYSPNNITLYVNGERVIDEEISTSNIDFLTYKMLGFFSSPDIFEYSIDCVAIYPYLVPKEIIKKRYVYGQGVDLAENIASKFSGETFYTDFTFAGYTTTMNYPEMTPWESGFFNNLQVKNRILTSLEYEIPQIISSPVSSSVVFDFDILKDNYENQSEDEIPYINLKPNINYDQIETSIFLSTLNTLQSETRSFLGIFQRNSIDNLLETIVQFENSKDKRVFEIRSTPTGIDYRFFDEVASTTIYSENVLDQKIVVGLDFEKIRTSRRNVIGDFFDNLQNISLRIGNGISGQFTGNIYSTTFNDTFWNNKDLLDLFNEDGIADSPIENAAVFGSYIGSYTIGFIRNIDSISMETASKAYWEDSQPLSYFGKIVQDSSGNDRYDLDLLQFNIEYPSSPITSPNLSDIKDDLTLNSYITLQHYTGVGLTPYSRYTNTEDLRSTKVLDFDNTEDVRVTKFRVYDNTVIIPPKEGVDFRDYYITIHLEFVTKSNQSKPIILNRMHLSSISYNEDGPYPINTRTGNKIYPFSRVSDTYIYKDKNPFVISKESVSYLYLSGDSGIRVLPYSSNKVRGVAYPINQNQRTDYELGGIQFWILFDESYTYGETSKIIGSIRTPIQKLILELIPEVGGKRAKLRMYDERTGEEQLFVQYYQNGILVDNPYISPLNWSSIVIAFGEQILLNSVIGSLEFYPGIIVNNIVIFEKSSEVIGQTIFTRSWDELLEEEETSIPLKWSYWREIVPAENRGFWINVFQLLETLKFTIDAEGLFRSYLGLSTVVADDSAVLSIDSQSVSLITEVVWNNQLLRPL